MGYIYIYTHTIIYVYVYIYNIIVYGLYRNISHSSGCQPPGARLVMAQLRGEARCQRFQRPHLFYGKGAEKGTFMGLNGI